MTNSDLSESLLALGNKTRREIIRILSQNESATPNVDTALTFIAKTLNEPLAKISRHVSCLEDVGLLRKESNPPWVGLRLNREKMNEILNEIKGILK